MSGLVGLLLVSVSVGLSNFAGAIGIGLSGIDARTRLRVGLAFGLFEALMPIIGLLLALAVYQINIVLAAATMGVISVALSLVGLELGSRLGSRVEAWSEELGGTVLILVGLAIAVGLLG